MPAKVKLKIASGELVGQEFVFDCRDSCFAGRSKDCRIRVPGRVDKQVSRHHCLLDINPPDIRIRDYGSLNGTWINEASIGKRPTDQAAEAAKAAAGDAMDPVNIHDLADGDRLRLGQTVFEVSIELPIVCGDCMEEISTAQQPEAEIDDGIFRCVDCQARLASDALDTVPSRAESVPQRPCAECGRDVSEEIAADRQGDYVCESCRKEPSKLLQSLLNRAQIGDQNVVAIRGYKVLRKLGVGGMGEVYLAQGGEADREVALKVMLPQVAATAIASKN